MSRHRRRRPPSPGMMTIAAACGSLALLAGCSARVESARTPPPPTVTVVDARRMDVPVLANPIATTVALQQVVVRARVRGFLTEKHFEEGSNVKKGQLLFVIDEEPYQVALDQAKAQLADARAALERAQKAKNRETAKAQVTVRQAQLALARIEESRQRKLAARNAASAQDVDQAEANRRQADGNLEAASASLEQANADYDVDIHAAEAKVEAAGAAVRDAEINLGYCRMYAPIDGRIGEAKVKLGNLVGPAGADSPASATAGSGYTELATIQQLDPMGVDIQASSRVLDRAARLIRQGITFKIYRPGLEGDSDKSYTGRALFFSNQIDPTTSTFLIRGEVANPDETLLPGEYVKAVVVVDQLPYATVVPEQAVVETQAGPTVATVDKDGKVKVLQVKAGITYEGLRVIESGLSPGQPVIVEGLQLVRPGMAVKAERAAEPTRPAPAAAKPGGPAPASPPAGPAGSGTAKGR